MAKTPSKKPDKIETVPDGWDRFTKAVKRMAPKRPKQTKAKRQSKKRSAAQ